jgi:hypothetical protein
MLNCGGSAVAVPQLLSVYKCTISLRVRNLAQVRNCGLPPLVISDGVAFFHCRALYYYSRSCTRTDSSAVIICK